MIIIGGLCWPVIVPGGAGAVLAATSRWSSDPKRAHSWEDCFKQGSGRGWAGRPVGSRPVTLLPSRLRWGEVAAFPSVPKRSGPGSPWDSQWSLSFPSVFWKSVAFGDSLGQVEKILRLDQVKDCQKERASQHGGWSERACGWTSGHGWAWC